MKLQVVFNSLDLEKELNTAQTIAEFCDQITIGQLLLAKYGIHAITSFRQALPKSIIIADTKIIEFCKDTTRLYLDAGSDWVTVLAGASQNIIHATCSVAHEMGKKVMLDLIDAQSRGQSALQAKSYGADAIIFHQSHDDYNEFDLIEEWDMIKGNADLPIYISAKITPENIYKVTQLSPYGILIGKAITQAEDPIQAAKFFRQLI